MVDTVGPSKKGALLINNLVADEKMGVVSAFTRYDPDKETDPTYFKESLENSLSQAKIREYCEDFLKLLTFNKEMPQE